MKHNISRYEEKSDSLFICINHTEKPIYLEHFFTEEERATEESRKETIEKLVAELEVKADEYVEPEQYVSKVEEAKAFTLSSKKISDVKIAYLTKRELEKQPKEELEIKE